MNKMISISKVSKLTGVTIKTLKIWDNENKLNSAYRTVGGHRQKLEPNEEMVQDLISIVTCFSARLYGARGGRKLKGTIKELEKERGVANENNYKSNTN